MVEIKSQSSGIVNDPVNQIPPIPHDTGNNIKSDSSISGFPLSYNPVRPGAEAKPGEKGSTPFADTLQSSSTSLHNSTKSISTGTPDTLQSSSKGTILKKNIATIPPPYKPLSLAPDTKNKLVVSTCESLATQYGVPAELANLFFMKLGDSLYIKNPGLLYLAGKIGYSRIEITDSYNPETLEWTAECKIYPKLTKDLINSISKLDKENQQRTLDFLMQPTNGTGRASIKNVRMSTMHSFLREMAQTRAQNRALRAYTGYGSCSLEELDTAELDLKQ